MLNYDDYFLDLKLLKTNAERLFGAFENNLHTFKDLAKKIDVIKGDEFYPLFQDALKCMGINQYRPAILLAWVGTVHFLHDLAYENQQTLRARFNTFPSSIEEMQDKL